MRSLCLGEELLLWRGAKFLFRRGYFCYGGGGVFEFEGYSTIYVLEGMWEEIK